MTTTRLNDAGYNANSAKFHDNLVWNGTGGASYEWYWEGYLMDLKDISSSRTKLIRCRTIIRFSN